MNSKFHPKINPLLNPTLTFQNCKEFFCQISSIFRENISTSTLLQVEKNLRPQFWLVITNTKDYQFNNVQDTLLLSNWMKTNWHSLLFFQQKPDLVTRTSTIRYLVDNWDTKEPRNIVQAITELVPHFLVSVLIQEPLVIWK